MNQDLLICFNSSIRALSVLALLLIITLPSGLLLVSGLKIKCHKFTRITVALALGFVLQAVVVFFIHYFTLQHLAYAYWWLAFLPVLGLFKVRLELNAGFSKLLIFFVFVFLIISHLMLFPFSDYRLVTSESSRALSGYYTDNLISFDVARIFTEARSITKTIVVPVWTFFDRTPIAGALVAYFWFVFGIRENAQWLGSSPGNFFYYQEQLIVLNLLSVFALAVFMYRKSANILPAMAILLVGPFVFFNIGFAWPKFFAAFFAIVGLDLFTYTIENGTKTKREFVISGFFLGVAYLCHDTAIFFIASLFAVLVLWSICFRSLVKLRQILPFFIGVFIAVVPWFLFRYLYEEKSSHMLSLHLLCVTDFSYQNMTTSQALTEYLKNNSVLQIIEVKFGNLFYPFSIVDAIKSLKGDYLNFPEWLKVFSILSKYQLIHAVSLPAFIVSIWGMWRRKSEIDLVWLICLSGLLSIIPAAILFGCVKSTWNHTWVYTTVLLLTIPLQNVISKYSVLSYLLFISGLSLLVCQLVLQVNFFLMATTSFMLWLIVLILTAASVFYLGKRCEQN